MKPPLLDCPFCGEQPILEKNGEKPTWRLHHDCMVTGMIWIPCEDWWPLTRLIAAWENRTTPVCSQYIHNDCFDGLILNLHPTDHCCQEKATCYDDYPFASYDCNAFKKKEQP